MKEFAQNLLHLEENSFVEEKPLSHDLLFYILFNSILVMTGRWASDNERLCTRD